MPRAPHVITPDLLATVPDGELEALLLEYILALQSNHPEQLEGLPRPMQAHYIAFVADGEILNGGFNQLFFNDPTLAFDLPEALHVLDQPEAAALATEALTQFASVYPGHEAARAAGTVEALMATCDDLPFDPLDQAYAELEEQLRLGRIAYIRANADSFRHGSVAG